ncbi:DUF732 domain-containing protein [Gordonia terrae]
MRTDPPAWHKDPNDPGILRWWDGQKWTAHTHPYDDQLWSSHTFGSTPGATNSKAERRAMVVLALLGVAALIAVAAVIIVGSQRLETLDATHATATPTAPPSPPKASASAPQSASPAPTTSPTPPPAPSPPPNEPPSPDDEKFISETAFVMTATAGGVSMDRDTLIALGRDICTYLRDGHSAEETIWYILTNGPSWRPDHAAVVVGAATGTLCEDQRYKTPG